MVTSALPLAGPDRFKHHTVQSVRYPRGSATDARADLVETIDLACAVDGFLREWP
jgi:hypothetical protein